MTDLSPYLNRFDILNETAQQLIKDFGIAGIEIRFSGKAENAYTELFSQVHPHIEKLLKANFRDFYNLMYRIDISEDQIRKEAANTKDRSFSEIVTDLILKRELVKVIFRRQYSR